MAGDVGGTERLAKVLALVDRHRAVDSALYEAGLPRHALCLEGAALLRRTYATLPDGLAHFAPGHLGREGARYLHVDLRGRRGGFVNGARVEVAIHTLRGGRAVDEATGADLGAVVPASLGAYEAIPRELFLWEAARQCAPIRGLWTSLPFHGRAGDGCQAILLPLSGTGLEALHPVVARATALAGRVLDGGVPVVEALRAIDARQDALAAEADAIEAEAARAATAGVDVGALAAAHPALWHALRTHDYDFDYADRPSRQSADVRTAIQDGLARLPAGDAVALYVAGSGGRWRAVRSHLRRHPALAADEGARRAA